MALKEDYLDDILDTSVNEKRKYRMINNADGTISLEDVTEYSQNGDNFGASDINITNKTVNELIAMGLNVRCNSNGYLEVFVDGAWEQTELNGFVKKESILNNGILNPDYTFMPYSRKGGSGTVSFLNGIMSVTATSFAGYRYMTKMDLTNVSKFYVNFYGSHDDQTSSFLIAETGEGDAQSYIVGTNVEGDYELDVSSFSGEYYIGFNSTYNNVNSSNRTTYCTKLLFE